MYERQPITRIGDGQISLSRVRWSTKKPIKCLFLRGLQVRQARPSSRFRSPIALGSPLHTRSKNRPGRSDVAKRKIELIAGIIGPAGMTGNTSSHVRYLLLFSDHALEHLQDVDIISGRIIAAELMDCVHGGKIIAGSTHG